MAAAAPTSRTSLLIERVRPAYAQVAEQLRELIVRGDLAPGERLPVESELSTMFGVSRSTIREALRTLTSQNLVETRRGVNGGTFIVHPDAGHIGAFLETSLGLLSGAEVVTVEEMLEARELLEVPAARLAATRRSPEQLAVLRESLVDREGVDGVRRYEGHRTFHQMILEASGNRLLEVMTAPVFSVLRTRFLRDRASASFWRRVHDEHAGIVDAIEAKDRELAARLMFEHLEHLRATYKRIDKTASKATR